MSKGMERHLNYIGSKHTLLEWLSETILRETGWSSFEGKQVADLFAGTGVVSFFFRSQGATVFSNDIEPCSSIVTKAMTECCFTDTSKQFLEEMNRKLVEGNYKESVGFLTRNYSPYEGCERMFFTVDNAKRMDYIRRQIEESNLTESEKVFVLASLLVSADSVANCASVYGAYLKKFKKVAEKPLLLTPIHSYATPTSSKSYSRNILEPDFLQNLSVDLVYLDPPYNSRQYSKNYFPLSVLTQKPVEQNNLILSGKTGIPSTCFTSPFCSKKTVAQSFETVLSNLKAKWVFLSYNSESLLSKEEVLTILNKYGTAKCLERTYKRFQSQKSQEKEIKEYLFCLKRL